MTKNTENSKIDKETSKCLLYESIIIETFVFIILIYIFGNLIFFGEQGFHIDLDDVISAITASVLHYIFILLPLKKLIIKFKKSKSVSYVLYAIIALILNPVTCALIFGFFANR